MKYGFNGITVCIFISHILCVIMSLLQIYAQFGIDKQKQNNDIFLV